MFYFILLYFNDNMTIFTKIVSITQITSNLEIHGKEKQKPVVEIEKFGIIYTYILKLFQFLRVLREIISNICNIFVVHNPLSLVSMKSSFLTQ